MRILVFSDIFCEDTTTFIYNEVIGLTKKNHEVLYLCGERRNEEKFPFENVVVIPYLINHLLKKTRWYLEIYDKKLSFKNKVYSHQITKEIEAFAPDIIHCHFGYQALKLLDNFNYGKIPVAVTFHGYDATFKFKRKSYVNSLKKHINDWNVYVFLACAFFKENFIKNQISLDNGAVLYCGIDMEFFKRTQYNSHNKPFTFLQIASFHNKKGHHYTVMAFKKLIHDHPEFDCRLVFGGEGPHLNEIKKLVKLHKLDNKIIFKGLVSPVEVRQLLDEADCFVHHSITSDVGDSEACTNSIMEAMAMELPVISTLHGGIPEMVIDGLHGFLVKEKDIAAYAKKMWEIKNWGYKIENRNYIASKFEIGIHIQNLETGFKKIISKSANEKRNRQLAEQ